MNITNHQIAGRSVGAARLACAAAALLLAGSALAQPVLVPPQSRATPAGTNEESETARVNREWSEYARRQLDQNEENIRAHEAAVAAREAEIARQQAEYEAERERREREHAEALARWEADARACKAGNRARCAPQ